MKSSPAVARAVLLGLLLLAGCRARPEPRGRIVLIGLDGGSWNLIAPMIEAGQLPHLRALQERGVSADLASVAPVLSPVVWTSIATGRRPEAHGVRFFYADRYSIRVPTLWDRFAASGLRVGLYDYLVTWPPHHLPNGFVVPGWLRRDDSVWPPDLFQRIRLPRYAYSVSNLGSPEEIVANIQREVREKPRYWNRLWKELRPEVGAVTFYALDQMGHRFWYTVPGGSPPPGADPRFTGILPRTVREVDRAVGEIVASLGPADHVLIASDHGFRASARVNRRWGIRQDWLLATAGLDPRRDGLEVLSSFMNLTVRLTPGDAPAKEEALQKLAGFVAKIRAPGGSPAFDPITVHVPERPTDTKGYPDWFAQSLRETLPAYAVYAALVRPEAFERALREGYFLVDGKRVPAGTLAAEHDFTGEHDPVGIFFAAGPAIRHRPGRLRLSVLDIAPLMAYLAGQPIPDDLEGQFQRALIDPGYLDRHPPRTIPAARAPRLPAEKGRTDNAEDEETKRRLRALGYIQ